MNNQTGKDIEMEKAFMELAEGIKVLEAGLGELTRRLIPVCRPADPVPAPNVVPLKAAMSPMRDQVYAFVRLIDSANKSIKDTLSCLEI